MRFSAFACLLLSLSLAACERATPAAAAAPAPAPAAKPAEIVPGWQAGDALPDAKGVTLAELVAHPDAHANLPVSIDGTVTSVCEHRGCWVEIADGDNKVIVKSINHAIAFPRDGVGRKMHVEGFVRVDMAESCGGEDHAHENLPGEPAHECPKPSVLVEVRRASLAPPQS